VFVFVGRIVTDKGINELVEAFTKLQITHKSCSLLLVGPFEDDLDPVSEKTKKCISENAKIITAGYQEDVRIFYAVSNALVFPSYREGFPNVVMQAGAMGLPSIVCNINGCNEIIIDNKNGFVIPSKNREKLKEIMLRLITEADIYSVMRDNAREMIQSRYERTYMWEEILKEYKRLEKR
ncbi:MAG: glycosyltransferase, partial [Bacteroidetes bacterium]|nr:glycosyltransferase [Bacteroidota bacterium]